MTKKRQAGEREGVKPRGKGWCDDEGTDKNERIVKAGDKGWLCDRGDRMEGSEAKMKMLAK